MALGLITLIEALVLWTNAVAILNEERFLARHGWARSTTSAFDDTSAKAKIVNFMQSVRYLMRVPLILVNIAFILFEGLLG